MTTATYRAACYAEIPLTSESESALPDAELIAAALDEAHAVGITTDAGAPLAATDIRITTWTA